MAPTCLITGASGGVARALAQRLRADGWRLALATRHPDALPDDADATVLETDVATEAGALAAVLGAEAAFGAPPDAVVNAAGAILIAPIWRTSEAQYRACLQANLDTAFFVSKAYATLLDRQKRPGALLLFSSVAAAVGVGNHPVIAMAKAGIEALVRSLAADGAGFGLRVNAIAPGLMDTPATARLLASDTARAQVAAQYPLGRSGSADDAAALAAFLVSDAASWITGQTIALDGGFTAVRPFVRGR